ncbi:RNA 3'-terminal phosphate cyclase [Henriciella litoralis]|uniref:RNA 3'-terminal phosphate cyclase n=1 Tax=Henriciella litoralis TaxID=568102 RepID=UPI000A06397C|nr:RNA 3'-terminal phosphate cyclase [Henriciella litoralis]
MITIDGSTGEGGGQILRSSLTLAAATGEAVRVTNIRANRSRPGLLRQHLTALNAITEICGGHVTGGELGSSEITLRPGSVRAGDYHFSVGSAGSANLVLQTVLPALVLAGEPSKVTVQGGTHNPAAPPFDYLQECYFPALRKIGHEVRGELKSYGFYPAGGGELTVEIDGAGTPCPFEQTDRGEELSRSLQAIVANLPADIAKRELSTASRLIELEDEAAMTILAPDSIGPGNVLYGRLAYEKSTTLFSQFGEKGVSAQQVGKRLAKQMKAFSASSAAVDHHLADQLLLPMALAKGGVFSTLRPSLHATTNAETVSKFTGRRISFEDANGHFICSVL